MDRFYFMPIPQANPSRRMAIPAGRAGFPGIALVLLALVEPAGTQTVREVATGVRLESGYAQMLDLAATPDIAAARYEVDDGDEIPKISAYSLLAGLLGRVRLRAGFTLMLDCRPFRRPA